MKTKLTVIASLVCCCLIAAGCGNNRLSTAEVKGAVTLDGAPLTHGVVTFTPQKGRSATGIIQSDGSFVLSTYGNGDGAQVGIHKIGVVCSEKINSRAGSESTFDENEFTPRRSIIPIKYNDYSTSGLSYEVKAGQTNELLLELHTKS